MTTGNQQYDRRTFAYGIYVSGPSGLVTWSGNDSPAPPPTQWDVLHDKFVSSQLKANGKPYVIPAYRVRKVTPAQKNMRQENPLTYSRVQAESVIVTYSAGYDGYGNISGPVSPGTGVVINSDAYWSGNDEINLINRLRSKMQGSSFNPAAFLATSSSSLRLITESAQRLDLMYRMVRKGRLADAAKVITKGTSVASKRHRNGAPPITSKDLASAQLELSYGWLPLLSDAYEGAQFVAHNTQLPMMQSYRARLRRRGSDCTTNSIPNWAFGPQDVYSRGQLIARVSENFAFSTSNLSGLDDPLSMAWERLPWSFVADWFVPVQNYLLARSFARATVGTFVKTTGYEIKIIGASRIGPPSGYQEYGKFKFRERTFSRTVSSSLDVPLPKPKALDSVPSWRRCINAVSLLLVRNGSSPS